MTYHGRMMPLFARAVCDPGTLKTIQSGGRSWGGIQFYFDRWADFEMPDEDDPNYTSIQKGIENGHLEIRDGCRPPTEMEAFKQSVAATEKERDKANKQVAEFKTQSESVSRELAELKAEAKALKAERDKLAAQAKPAVE